MDRLRGFRDIFPEEAEPRKKIFTVSERISERFDFSKIEFPSIEFLELYRLKSGEELVGQTFSFTDKGGREVALTPEATPSIVRMITSRKDLQMPSKWYSFQRYWRYEEPQSGRQREFYQYNADIFGLNSKEADAEVIGLACTILDEVGLDGKYSMKINSRELMESILTSAGLTDLERGYSVIDKLKKSGTEQTERELRKIGMSEEGARKLLSLIENEYDPDNFPFNSFTDYGKDPDILNRLVETGKLVKKYTRSSVVIDLSIVRGLTYYTGVVFEAYDLSGTFRSILGGGRYDRLASLMSQMDIPAIGFGMGDVILELLLKQNGDLVSEASEKSISICYADSALYDYSLSVANRFRQLGYRTSISLSGKSLSSQLRSASKWGFRYAGIIGEIELESASVTVKNMKTGQQKAIEIDSLENLQDKI